MVESHQRWRVTLDFLLSAIRAQTIHVEIVIRQLKPKLIRNFFLALLNSVVRKLLYTTTPDTNNMVMMFI